MTFEEIHLLNKLLNQYKREYIKPENKLFSTNIQKEIQYEQGINAWNELAYRICFTEHELLEKKLNS